MTANMTGEDKWKGGETKRDEKENEDEEREGGREGDMMREKSEGMTMEG